MKVHKDIYFSRPFANRTAGDIRKETKEFEDITSWMWSDGLNRGFRFIDPFRGTTEVPDDQMIGYVAVSGKRENSGRYHSERDLKDVERSDAMIVWITEETKDLVSIGCIYEIAWAAQRGTPIFMLRPKDAAMKSIFIDNACSLISDDPQTLLSGMWHYFHDEPHPQQA